MIPIAQLKKNCLNSFKKESLILLRLKKQYAKKVSYTEQIYADKRQKLQDAWIKMDLDSCFDIISSLTMFNTFDNILNPVIDLIVYDKKNSSHQKSQISAEDRKLLYVTLKKWIKKADTKTIKKLIWKSLYLHCTYEHCDIIFPGYKKLHENYVKSESSKARISKKIKESEDRKQKLQFVALSKFSSCDEVCQKLMKMGKKERLNYINKSPKDLINKTYVINAKSSVNLSMLKSVLEKNKISLEIKNYPSAELRKCEDNTEWVINRLFSYQLVKSNRKPKFITYQEIKISTTIEPSTEIPVVQNLLLLYTPDIFITQSKQTCSFFNGEYYLIAFVVKDTENLNRLFMFDANIVSLLINELKDKIETFTIESNSDYSNSFIKFHSQEKVIGQIKNI